MVEVMNGQLLIASIATYTGNFGNPPIFRGIQK